MINRASAGKRDRAFVLQFKEKADHARSNCNGNERRAAIAKLRVRVDGIRG
jgi:hypothetical protein